MSDGEKLGIVGPGRLAQRIATALRAGDGGELSSPMRMPITDICLVLSETLDSHSAAVVTSPPGTGKTSVLPLWLAARADGSPPRERILVTGPRRVTVRAAARRAASIIGEPVGQSVGYSVRGDSQVSKATRVEFVTTGIALRRLLRNPELPGISALVIDEIHERALDSDLLFAMACELRASGLLEAQLLAMSATAQTERIAEVLSAPVITATGEQHTLSIEWNPAPANALITGPTPPRTARAALTAHLVSALSAVINTHDGDALVFLPGVREISEAAAAVRERFEPAGFSVLELHGQLPARAQDRVFAPSKQRKIIISSAIAESSVTVPGVRIVVDAGLSREPRFDSGRSLPALITTRVSQASATQRAGRAAREGDGIAVRLYSPATLAAAPAYPTPEIESTDLSEAALMAAAWGDPTGESLPWLTPPPAQAWSAAREKIAAIGALTPDGTHLSELGQQIISFPAPPALAAALIRLAPIFGPERTAQAAAVLSESVRCDGADLPATWRQLRRGSSIPQPVRARWHAAATQLARAAEKTTSPKTTNPATTNTHPADDLVMARVVALAAPTHIARKRGGNYLLANGTGARLPDGSPLAGHEWLAVWEAQHVPGQADSLIRAAVPIDEELAREAGAALIHTEVSTSWHATQLRLRERSTLGALELFSRPLGKGAGLHALREPVRAAASKALQDKLAAGGLEELDWPQLATALRQRLHFCHLAIGDPWPDVSPEALANAAANPNSPLGVALNSEISRLAASAANGNRVDLTRLDLTALLRSLLPWELAAELDFAAPESIELPVGRRARIEYDGALASIRGRVQEFFGWTDVPTIAQGRVPLRVHLQTPAGRDAAITDNLARFWAENYAAVRADLRGRYPKHPWPEDPLAAQPTMRAKPRKRSTR